MPKLTWKESTLRYIKELVADNTDPLDAKNLNVFSIKQLTPYVERIKVETRSKTKSPERNLDKTLRELRDFNILRHRLDIGQRVYEYVPNHDNVELIYKEKRSIGHIRITKCLDRFKVRYEEEKTFYDLKHKSYLRIDIYFQMLHRRVAIEFDGIQHQKAVDIWGGDNTLDECQKRDLIKDQYCQENSITLLRVSHEVKDIEKYISTFVWKTIIDYIARCLLTVLIQLYLWEVEV